MEASVSTRGGCSFNQLCEGDISTYCSDNLVDIRGLTQLEEAKNKIVAKINDIIKSLETSREKRVAKIYLGKTYIHRRRASSNRYLDLNPMDDRTWRLKGISGRWNEHRRTDYGKDGMVVLAAVTKEAIPPQCQDRIHQQDYAFAIEQRLLHHFIIATADRRVVNPGFSTGETDQNISAAYAIYMAFAFEEMAQQEPAMSSLPISPEQDPSTTPPVPQTHPYSLLAARQEEITTLLPSQVQANDMLSTPAQLEDAGTLPPQNTSLPQPPPVGPLSLPIPNTHDAKESRDGSSDSELPPGWPDNSSPMEIGSHYYPIEIDSN